MKTIEYSKAGIAYPDDCAEDAAREFLLKPGDASIHVSTHTFIDAVRVQIHEGFIAHTDVVFIFEEDRIQPHKSGRLPFWPAGFCDVTERLLSRLLQ